MANSYGRLANLDDEEEAPAKGAGFARLANLDEESDQLPRASSASSAAATDETSWWKVATRQAGLVGRAGVQAVTSLPLMAADTGVAARNLVSNLSEGITPTWADFNPFASTGGTRQETELPSTSFNRSLTAAGLPEPRTALEKIEVFLGSVLGGARLPAPQAKTQAPTGFVRPAKSAAEQTLREAREAGYVIPPTSAKPTIVNKLTEGLAGKAATAQAASARNQEVTNELTRKALGLGKDTPITPQALKDLRTTAGKVYEQIGDTGDIVPDAQFLEDLTQLGRGADEIASAFPGANVGATKQIGEVVDSLLQEKFSSKAALQYLRELRKQASGNLSGINAADPAKQALGMAQREAAATLEDLIGRHLDAQGMTDVAQSFNQARRVIAMSHSVENALNETTGNVIAGKLGQQMARGKPLSGELETAAQFARAFPKASKEITESMPGISPLDWAMSIGGAIAANHLAPLAGVMARPAARTALLSNWWQQGLTDAVPYAPRATIGVVPSASIQAGPQ